MGFTGIKGNALTLADTQHLKKMFNGTLDGFLHILEESDASRYCRDKKFYPPLIQKMKEEIQAFNDAFDAAAQSDQPVDFRDFFDEKAEDIFNQLVDIYPSSSPEARGFRQYFGDYFLTRFTGTPPEMAQNSRDALLRTIRPFRLASKPMEGIETIAEYDPASADTGILDTLRAGNSGTLKLSAEDPQSEESKRARSGYHSGLAVCRDRAVELKNLQQVSFGILFETLSSINQALRPDDPRGGKLRAQDIAAGRIHGTSGLVTPELLTETLDTIAGHMNQIRQVADPLLRKTQAVQLAAFAYQTLLSEHMFDDGNGRTCRLFADTILQSFGLPPHTPSAGELVSVGTIGEKLDFGQCSGYYLSGVKKSDELIKAGTAAGKERHPDLAKGYLRNESMRPELADIIGAGNAMALAVSVADTKHCLIESILDYIAADHLFARNSKQYDATVAQSVELARTLYSNPLNSEASIRALKKMDRCLYDYCDHCERHPQSDSTRRKRLKATNELRDFVSALQSKAAQINESERKPYYEKALAIEARCEAAFANAETRTDAAAAYIYASGLIQDMKADLPKLSPEQLEQLLTEEAVAEGARKIKENGFVDRAITMALERDSSKPLKHQLANLYQYHDTLVTQAAKASNRKQEEPGRQMENGPAIS